MHTHDEPRIWLQKTRSSPPLIKQNSRPASKIFALYPTAIFGLVLYITRKLEIAKYVFIFFPGIITRAILGWWSAREFTLLVHVVVHGNTHVAIGINTKPSPQPVCVRFAIKKDCVEARGHAVVTANDLVLREMNFAKYKPRIREITEYIRLSSFFTFYLSSSLLRDHATVIDGESDRSRIITRQFNSTDRLKYNFPYNYLSRASKKREKM